MKPKIIRAFTISWSLDFIWGMLPEMKKKYEVVLLTSPGPEMDDTEGVWGTGNSCAHGTANFANTRYRFIMASHQNIQKRKACNGTLDDSESWFVVHDSSMDDKSTCACTYFYRIGFPDSNRIET